MAMERTSESLAFSTEVKSSVESCLPSTLSTLLASWAMMSPAQRAAAAFNAVKFMRDT
ncbi:hypothetical protein D3C73_1612980 [compost metagenome]